MSLQFCHFLTVSPRNNGPISRQVACEFLTRVKRDGILRRSQLLDGNQLQRLSQTLNRPNLYPDQSIMDHPPLSGDPVPAGYHLAYFRPSALYSGLGSDGSDQIVNPRAPFARRMGAGGEIIWTRTNPLKVGDYVTENTSFLSAVPKTSREGEEMIIVGVEKTFENDWGVALVDRSFDNPPERCSTRD